MKTLTFLIATFCVILTLAGCTENPTQETDTSHSQPTKPESSLIINTDEKLVEPILKDMLRRDCQVTPRNINFDQSGLAIGDIAINFALEDINGNEIILSQLLAEKPVVMVFGSFT